MAKNQRRIPHQSKQTGTQIRDVAKTANNIKNNHLLVSFENFRLDSIKIHNDFNNSFKDEIHYIDVITNLLNEILPKITSHTYNELGPNTTDGKRLHFHSINNKNHLDIIKKILKAYDLKDLTIEQIFEDKIFEFVATLGHTYPARVICNKVDNVLNLLFIDTNHHIYFNEKYVNDSIFYEYCPKYNDNTCHYMPETCFAVEYLDEKKLANSYKYDYDPNKE